MSLQIASELADRIRAAAGSYYEWSPDEDRLADLDIEIGGWVGSGEPRTELADTAESIGPDYICALEDGSLLAWGIEYPIPGANRTWREVVIVDEPATTEGVGQ